jgi:hypothetical protein
VRQYQFSDTDDGGEDCGHDDGVTSGDAQAIVAMMVSFDVCGFLQTDRGGIKIPPPAVD